MSAGTVRTIRIDGDVAYIPLTRGYTAIIDAADVPLVAAWTWGAKVDGRTVYAKCSYLSGGKQRNVLLHRVIAAAPDGVKVDHKSGDGLDNRRENLRFATTSQNQQNNRKRRDNTSGHKGVTFHKQCGKCQSQIKVNENNYYLGVFATIDDAAAAYAAASARLHGEFGRVA